MCSGSRLSYSKPQGEGWGGEGGGEGDEDVVRSPAETLISEPLIPLRSTKKAKNYESSFSSKLSSSSIAR